MSARLTFAIEHQGLALPDAGQIVVLHPRAGTDLSALPKDRTTIVQPFRPDHDFFVAGGFADVTWALPGADIYAAAVVCLPRAKGLARALVAQAAARTAGLVIVDGAKTDGADSLLRDIRKRVDIAGALSKAHGRIFWFRADAADFADWQAPADQQVDGFHTAPGVFSADGIDPASRMLADALPDHVGRRVADLGAGWGYLASRLIRDDRIEVLDLVEADRIALECARRNITDPRARFHWADAALWKPSEPVDAVVMNPPFHTGRSAEPSLGQSFIAAAARMLTRHGHLWMVANRHLPYEATLHAHFAQVEEIAGDTRFKVLRAARPSRPRR